MLSLGCSKCSARVGDVKGFFKTAFRRDLQGIHWVSTRTPLGFYLGSIKVLHGLRIQGCIQGIGFTKGRFTGLGLRVQWVLLRA